MSKLWDTFNICHKLPPNVRLNVKLYHVFDDIDGYNALIITHEDLAYGLGSNSCGGLGLGHNQPALQSPQLIPQLSHKNIRAFANGFNFVLALTGTGSLYGWGRNCDGQLGRGGEPTGAHVYHKPAKVRALSHKTITQITCGYYHALALSGDGQVYGWGDNLRCQVGVYERLNTISTPMRLKFPNKCVLSAVNAYFYQSYALTPDGRVFSWGNNYCNQLGHDKTDIPAPTPVVGLTNIQTVCPTLEMTYFLSTDGFVYICGKYRKVKGLVGETTGDYVVQKLPPIVIRKLPRFEGLAHVSCFHVSVPFIVGRVGNKVFKISDSLETVETSYKCFDDCFASECQLTYRTVVYENDVCFDNE